MKPEPWIFTNCVGYAFFGFFEEGTTFLSDVGLEDRTGMSFSNPRGLRFWFIDYGRAHRESRPDDIVEYKELSMAALVDVKDTDANCTEPAWHMPLLYVDHERPRDAGAAFGFQKELGTISLPNGDDGEYRVVDSSGFTCCRITAHGTKFHAVDRDQPIAHLEGDDAKRAYDFWPRCIQDVKGKGYKSPRLVVDETDLDITISTEGRVDIDLDNFPKRTPFQKTNFVLRIRFSMCLYLEDNVCVA